MALWNVYKGLVLRVCIEGDSGEEAVDKMLNLDDRFFEVFGCDHEARPISGTEEPAQVDEALVRGLEVDATASSPEGKTEVAEAPQVFSGAEAAHRRGLEVEAYLMASTEHLTPSERRRLLEDGKTRMHSVTMSMTDDFGGAMVCISAEGLSELEMQRASEGFRMVLELAYSYGILHVRFHPDGRVIEGVPTYEDAVAGESS